MTTSPDDVVVTGLGAITPVGLSAPETWQALCAGRSGVGALTHFDATDFSVKIAAEVRGYKPPEPYKGKGVRYVGEAVIIKETKKK